MEMRLREREAHQNLARRLRLIGPETEDAARVNSRAPDHIELGRPTGRYQGTTIGHPRPTMLASEICLAKLAARSGGG